MHVGENDLCCLRDHSGTLKDEMDLSKIKMERTFQVKKIEYQASPAANHLNY